MGGVIANILGGDALGGVAKIINAIKGKNPEDAAKIQELLAKHEDLVLQTQAELEKAKIDENVKLNQTAADVYKADAASNKPIQAYARPMVIWVGLFMLVWNYCLVPVVLFKYGWTPVVFPDMFWETWGVLALGCVVTRTVDKAAANTLGGAGGSVNLPFGFKLDSKGK